MSDGTGTEVTMRGKSVALVLAAVVLALDLWSKHAVFAWLGLNERHWVAGEWFGFQAVLNPGIMWGQLRGLAPYLPWLRVLAAIVVLVMTLTTPARARRTLVALGLVLGGALGNIYDGFVVSKVRDFLLVDLDVPVFDPFPVFNVADSAICIGVGLLAIGMIFEKPTPRPEE